jgi:hypothetical protein
MVELAVGAVPGEDVPVGAGALVGKETVGKKVSVARAMGEQAANPPSIPSAPTFIASLREIFLVMAVPPKSKRRITVIGEALMPLREWLIDRLFQRFNHRAHGEKPLKNLCGLCGGEFLPTVLAILASSYQNYINLL